jgi:membrane protein involved in colicin uptake
LFEPADRVQIIRVVNSKTLPIDEAHATPLIQQFLFSQQSTQAIVTDLRQLREKAKIAYVGEFVVTAAEADAKANTAVAVKAKAAQEAKAVADIEAQTKADKLSKTRSAAEAKSREEAGDRAKADELARARRAADAKSRLEVESKQAVASTRPPQSMTPELEKAVRGLIR